MPAPTLTPKVALRYALCLLCALCACTPQLETRSAAQAGEVRLEPHFTGLVQPTDLRFVAPGVALATEQAGRLVRVERDTVQEVTDLEPYVSCCGEQGLLSLALHPGFAENGLVYLYYTARSGETVLARLPLGPKTLEPLSDVPEVLYTISQPGPTHNGGQLQVGPDGALYLATGDGIYRPSWFGALQNAQRPDTPLGKVLRFELGSRGDLAEPQIVALGLRNPWRFSFDAEHMFIADVGETAYEEVNVVPLGAPDAANFGWPEAEGPVCRRASCEAYVTPVLTYDHEQGCSVTGGYVYRSQRVPALRGHYLYGDFCSGRVWAAEQAATGWQARELLDSPLVISSFARDSAGEVYLVDYASGTVYRLSQ